LVSVDWRNLVETEPVRKKSSTDWRLIIYEKLKNNVKNLNTDVQLVTPEYDNYIKGDTIENSKSNLCTLVKVIDKLEKCTSEYCCILGTELANFKYLHISNKCNDCINETDIYKVLDCKTCSSIKNKMKDCYSKMTDIIHKSRDCINFYIWIAKLCQKYPKFRHVAISTNDIKKVGYNYLQKMMCKDEALWT